ncbi:hypothetical protein MASR2M79_04560 [Aminivibrio sp.]
MKKILALFLAAVLMCALAVPSFAAYKDEYKLDIVPSLSYLHKWANLFRRSRQREKRRKDQH